MKKPRDNLQIKGVKFEDALRAMLATKPEAAASKTRKKKR